MRDRAGVARRSRAEGDGAEDAGRGEALRQALDLLPEERDIVVHELRSKVRKGKYFISSREIVDALLGRLAAGLTAE